MTSCVKVLTGLKIVSSTVSTIGAIGVGEVSTCFKEALFSLAGYNSSALE